MKNLSEEEERRQEILKTRAEHKRLADMIVQGIEHHETMTVRGKDGRDYQIEIHAITDDDFMRACADLNIEVPEGGKPARVGLSVSMMSALAAAGTSDPDIAKNLAPLESMKIAGRVLELSGAPGGPKPQSTSTASLKGGTPNRSKP